MHELSDTQTLRLPCRCYPHAFSPASPAGLLEGDAAWDGSVAG